MAERFFVITDEEIPEQLLTGFIKTSLTSPHGDQGGLDPTLYVNKPPSNLLTRPDFDLDQYIEKARKFRLVYFRTVSGHEDVLSVYGVAPPQFTSANSRSKSVNSNNSNNSNNNVGRPRRFDYDQIKYLRRTTKYTIQEIALLVGCSVATVNKVIRIRELPCHESHPADQSHRMAAWDIEVARIQRTIQKHQRQRALEQKRLDTTEQRIADLEEKAQKLRKSIRKADIAIDDLEFRVEQLTELKQKAQEQEQEQ